MQKRASFGHSSGLMTKHILAILLLSLAVVYFKNQTGQFLHAIVLFYDHIRNGLIPFFSHSNRGYLIQTVLALTLVPSLTGVLVTVVLNALKREPWAGLWQVLWGIWLVLVVVVLVR